MGEEEIQPEEAPLEPGPEHGSDGGQDLSAEALPEATDNDLASQSLGEIVGDLPPLEEGAPPSEDTLSVDELLSAAVAEEPIFSEAVSAASSPSQPTFQLRLSGLTEEQKNAFRKVLEAQSAAVPPQAWTGASPVVSQLTDFQAIQLLQAARALGISVQPSVHSPSSVPSEEDLALGELSGVPDQSPAAVESAPSVALPRGEKDVLLCSPSQLPNANVAETFGLVIAHRSIARRMFREDEMKEKLEKELRSVPNRASPPPIASSHLQILLRDLLLDLRKGALAKGANSVLGVKIEAFPESSSSDPLLEQLRLVAFGTAAVVEKT
jgi:hypothetical protein